MPRDPAILAHQEWLGYVQPTGLVVSIPSLIDANAFLNRNYGPEHQHLLSALPQDADGTPVAEISDFARFAQDVLGWDSELMLGSPGADPVPPELEVNLENYNETLRPTYALRSLNGDAKWLLLVEVLPTGTDFDTAFAPHDRGWQASPQARFERLLRQTAVHIGLLVNGRQIRLVYAPEKELSGHITFNLGDMVKVAGRPIFAALQMLLGAERLYSVADKERLPAILANSRKYQNVVSTQLATQVLEALYELLRGFQAANDQSKGDLLRDVLARDPDDVYHGLLTTLLRLVFVLFAEDRGLLSTDPIYSNYYSITGLYERLRADAGRYPDTMDQRYGAWAQLLALFGLMYSGGSHGAMKIPAREGYLFDPERYLFLEGRHGKKDKPEIPRVSDGVVYRVLTKLLLLDGERLSYRTLAVEQIGSVYQAIMGFSLQVATGRSIAIKPAKKHGAPATVNLEELLATPADKRLKLFTEETDQKLTGQAADALKSAKTIEDIMPALQRKIASTVTPTPVPKGAMIFQPSDERRKSGSHYTPSSLTGPIVEAALEPVLKQLGPSPTPAQILNLKVCDLAMGSAAFLVEACRQLGDALSKAWHSHGEVPSIPLDEDEALYAQRLIAQRCLYGLDKNRMAADLAKLSLWLATLAKDHPFTFLDHSLRHGDALVGLTRKQIASFNWAPAEQKSFLEEEIRKRIDRATQYRQRILNARDNVSYAQLAQDLTGADEALNLPRIVGDAAIAAFFAAEKTKQREETRRRIQALVEADLKRDGFIPVDGDVDSAIKKLHIGSKGVVPFHWELEFPEVFNLDEKGQVFGGFDVIVGNPPFAGKNTLLDAHAEGYLPWLQMLHSESHGNSDLVAHFFRRAFTLLRANGRFGLIATNTIGQGDTRSTGLRWICTHGGTIYRARKRLKWPGEAAVIVSVVHVCKGELQERFLLDGREAPIITAYLFHAGGHEDPAQLTANEGKGFIGVYVLGMGFTFDDTDKKGVATPLAEMERLIAKNPCNRERIFAYVGGDEVNDSPTHAHHRYVINFDDFPLRRDDLRPSWANADDDQRDAWLRSGIVPLDYADPVAADWPDLLNILEQKVKPDRLKDNRENYRRYWWRFAERRPGLSRALRGLNRFIAVSRVGQALAFAFLPAGALGAESLVLIADERAAMFALFQSRVHEIWARFMASSMKDDLRYTPSDCFETFPFPLSFKANEALEQVGRQYYEFRAQMMQRKNKGLTAIYNLFHDRDCDHGDIIHLRELHDTMDRTVLDAYGWANIQPSCEFIPEFEDENDDEDEARRRKEKYRYRWPDEIRDKVLTQLLEVNQQRALEEGKLVAANTVTELLADAKSKKMNKKKAKSQKSTQDVAGGLFAVDPGEA
jgi:N-6 DNA Methylase